MLNRVAPVDVCQLVGLDHDRGVDMQEMSSSMQMKMGSGMVMGLPKHAGHGLSRHADGRDKSSRAIHCSYSFSESCTPLHSRDC